MPTSARLAAASRLTSRQKWKLAVGLVLLYYPILTYIDFPEWDHNWAGVLDIPAAARRQYRIAPLTLQLLVENSVKHNQMSTQR